MVFGGCVEEGRVVAWPCWVEEYGKGEEYGVSEKGVERVYGGVGMVFHVNKVYYIHVYKLDFPFFLSNDLFL